ARLKLAPPPNRLWRSPLGCDRSAEASRATVAGSVLPFSLNFCARLTRKECAMAGLGFRSGAASFAAAALCAGVATAAEPVKTPTFTKDVAPIFQAKCETCHRTDSMAPMSLATYQEARPWARSIKARVAARQMPPWHVDKNVGIQEFTNDRSLTDAEID